MKKFIYNDKAYKKMNDGKKEVHIDLPKEYQMKFLKIKNILDSNFTNIFLIKKSKI